MKQSPTLFSLLLLDSCGLRDRPACRLLHLWMIVEILLPMWAEKYIFHDLLAIPDKRQNLSMTRMHVYFYKLRNLSSNSHIIAFQLLHFVLSVPFIILLNIFPIIVGSLNLNQCSFSSTRFQNQPTSCRWSLMPSANFALPTPWCSCTFPAWSWDPSFDAEPGVWLFDAPARLYAFSMFCTPQVLNSILPNRPFDSSAWGSLFWLVWSDMLNKEYEIQVFEMVSGKER